MSALPARFNGIAIPFASIDAIARDHRQMNLVLKIHSEIQ